MDIKNNRLYKYFQQNKSFCIIMLVCFCLLLLQLVQAVSYADDFALKPISNAGWLAIFKNQVNHYFTWGGGFTPILVTSFQRFPDIIWKTFIGMNMFAIVALCIKLLKPKNNKEKSLLAIVLWSSIFFLSVNLTRETILWLDGSMAYVFTTAQVFIYLYFMLSRIFNNVKKKYDVFLMPILAFFAGWSSAQSGAVAAIIPTTIILYAYFVKKYKPSKLINITNIIGIIGFCIFFFSPGNASRMSVLGEFSTFNVLDKVLFRVDSIFNYMFNFLETKFNTMPFFIFLVFALILSISLEMLSNNKKKFRNNKLFIVCIVILCFFLVMNLCVSLNLFGSDNIISYLISFTNLYEGNGSLLSYLPYCVHILVALASLVLCFYICKEEDRHSSIILLFTGYFCQAAMVMAPYSAYRTGFITILFLMGTISELFLICYRKKINIFSIVMIPFVIYNIYLLFVAILGKYLHVTIIKKENRFLKDFSVVISIFALIAILNYADTTLKYRVNKKIYNTNIQLIQDQRDSEIIKIYAPQYPLHGFGGLNVADFSVEGLKSIYKLKPEARFEIISQDD